MHGFLKLGWVGTGGYIAGVSGWFNTLWLRPGLFWALTSVVGEAGGGTLTVLGLDDRSVRVSSARTFWW